MTAGAAAGYRRCEAVTRRRAGNFFYGIRLLPADKRRAICAVYAFARRVDDIGDGSLPREDKLRLLDEARGDVQGLPGYGTDLELAALADACERFALPLDAFLELIEGVRMDVTGSAYERFDELLLYCRRVAGTIGRLCVAVFGSHDAETAATLADDLGVALQLTNILRDVREDAENGRVYLPAEDLARFGWGAAENGAASQAIAALARSANGSAPDDVAALIRFEVLRGQEWYARGLALIPLLDRRSAACVMAMAGIYRRLLDRIEAHPEQVLRGRMSLPAWEKVWVATRCVVGAER